MNVLTVARITEISNRVDRRSGNVRATLVPSTPGYITHIVRPLAEVMEHVNVVGIKAWIPSYFDKNAEDFVSAAIVEKLQLLNNGTTDIDEEYTEDSPELDEVAREALFEFIVQEIISTTREYIKSQVSIVMWPWDVQVAVAKNEVLNAVFCIFEDVHTLPVSVLIRGNKFTYNLTHELAVGLALFGHKDVSNADYKLVMFDAPFTADELLVKEGRQPIDRFTYDDVTPNNYSVVIKGRTYGFKTPEFMQGICTGALWIGVDHHNYWTDLREYQYDGDNVQIFKLTF